MLSRVLEESGVTTVTVVTVREHAEKVKPPRALFVPFALGFTLGMPNDPDQQHRVLSSAFDLLRQESGPVLVDFPEEEAPGILLQASYLGEPSGETSWSAADEITSMRGFYEARLAENNGATSVGLSGIQQRRFRGVVRFLEAYAAGEEVDMKERPADVPLEQFIRFCVDDLKAFLYEARITQRHDGTPKALHQWFWDETATGQLVVKVADRMRATNEGKAFGIAR